MRTESEGVLLRTNAGCALSSQPSAAEEEKLFLLACYPDQIIVESLVHLPSHFVFKYISWRG
jgi:hypothetical protein